MRITYHELSLGMRVLVTVLGVIVAPAALPAWVIETVARKRYPQFEFSILNATPYLLTITIMAAAGIIWTDSLALQVILLYFLALLELISLSICAAIAVITPGRLQLINILVARRSFRPRPQVAQGSTIYAVVASAGYAVVFYGAFSYALWKNDHSYFSGAPVQSSNVYIFWGFLQSSFLVIINGGPAIATVRFLSTVIWDLERMSGVFFLVFLLAVLASGWTERALRTSNERDSRGRRGLARGTNRRR